MNTRDTNAIISVNGLKKDFGENNVLKDINFSVKRGDVTCIIGSSGSGKSTMLRCINLLEEPTDGEIIYNGKNILETKNIPAYRAKVEMVFQSFNLFENMTVLKNCMIGQRKVLKVDKETAKKEAMFYLDKVGMAPYINAKPRQLSGGQKQRVAIARALAMKPDVILFDEPTSALDPQMVGERNQDHCQRRSYHDNRNPRNGVRARCIESCSIHERRRYL